MKTLIPLVLLVCGGCATSWPVYDSALTRGQIRQDKSHTVPLRLAVKAAPEAECRLRLSVPPDDEWVKSDMGEAVSNLVADLLKTGIFRSVNAWTPELRFDILIESWRADGIIRCGTPFVMRPFTLYLLSGESSYSHMYEFRFLAPDERTAVGLNRDYSGSYYAPSIVFLPFLSWQRRTTEADLLRHDIVHLIPQIEALRNDKEPEQGGAPYSSPAAGSESGDL
jgi:hypothetical protein